MTYTIIIVTVMVVCCYIVHRDIIMLREYIDSISLKETDIKPNTEHTEIDKSLRNEKGFFSYKKYIG